MNSKSKSTLLALSAILATSYAGGAEGKETGKVYSQLSYSPVTTSNFMDHKGNKVEEEFLTRHKVENYGEVGIWNNTTAVIWNISLVQQDIAGQSNLGLGPSTFGLQHQYLNSSFKLGLGIATELPSASSSKAQLSHSRAINSASHFLSYGSNQVNIHLMVDGIDQAIAYDYSYTWQPASGLYIKGVIRGQKSLSTLDSNSSNLGLNLQTEYIAPGVEAFYSLNSNWHLLGAFYGGVAMKNIYSFPGLKVGIAWTN